MGAKWAILTGKKGNEEVWEESEKNGMRGFHKALHGKKDRGYFGGVETFSEVDIRRRER